MRGDENEREGGGVGEGRERVEWVNRNPLFQLMARIMPMADIMPMAAVR